MKTTFRLFSLMLSFMLLVTGVACAKQNSSAAAESNATVPEVSNTEQVLPEQTAAPKQETVVTENAEPEKQEQQAVQEPEQIAADDTSEAEQVRVAALAGPTGIGLAYLPILSDAYQMDLYTAPDQVTAKIINGEVDIAAVPVNLGSVLFNKTNGGVTVIAVNTLGVLYFVENGDSIHSISDLAGKTVYATGQGSTPQYILEKILADNGLSGNVAVEYIAENTELVAKLIDGSEVQIAFIPEPQVSNACMKNESVRVALSANNLWNQNSDTGIVQGIYLVRTEYLNEHAAEVERFLTDAAESVDRVLHDENAPAVVVERGILGAEPIAKKAIPNCNIVLVSGSEMKELVSGMLQVLFEANPQSVGGKLPEDGFYYVP